LEPEEGIQVLLFEIGGVVLFVPLSGLLSGLLSVWQSGTGSSTQGTTSLSGAQPQFWGLAPAALPSVHLQSTSVSPTPTFAPNSTGTLILIFWEIAKVQVTFFCPQQAEGSTMVGFSQHSKETVPTEANG
jgi:hypothetical protein